MFFMEHITIEHVNKNILLLQREIHRIRKLLEEKELVLEDDVIEDIEESRERSGEDFISHEEMKKEFG